MRRLFCHLGRGWVCELKRVVWSVALFTVGGFSWATTTAADFDLLIKEAELEFTRPTGFVDIPSQANSLLPYERAIRHEKTGLEVRYAVRPLGRIQIEYDDPHSAAPEPDHLFPLLFASLTDRLSSGGDTPRREYTAKQAQELFNADWAAVSVFDVKPEFSKHFSQGLLIALHKNGKADAYTVFLFNDYSQVKEVIDNSLSALAFD